MTRNILTISLIAATFTACDKQQTSERQPTAVRTVAAQVTSMSNDVRYSGIVAPDTQVDLAFRVTGYVEQLGMARDGAGRMREIQEGDFIGAGTTLARLRPTEYQTRVTYAQAVAADAAASLSALKAQLSEVEASLLQAQRDHERASSLFSEKAMTKADFDAVQARRDAASAKREAVTAQIAAQQARIEGAGAQHREAAVSLSDTVLVTPFPAVVIDKRVARGSLVGAGAPAFVLADTRVAKVSFGVPDLALAGFNPGDTLTVVAEALPDREFRGRVSSIAAAADPTSRVFAVEVSIPNSDQALKVGMVATVIVSGARDSSPAPSIPLAAVVKSPSGYGVYTVDGTDRVRLQPVTLGSVKGNSVVITAGLNPGQRVVAAGGLQLSDGEAVKQIP
jgi:multidrug efflux system membrane fusion protein